MHRESDRLKEYVVEHSLGEFAVFAAYYYEPAQRGGLTDPSWDAHWELSDEDVGIYFFASYNGKDIYIPIADDFWETEEGTEVLLELLDLHKSEWDKEHPL